MASVILGLGFYSPAVHHYMIAVPGGYAINWPRAGEVLLGAVARFTTIPGPAGGTGLFWRRVAARRRTRARWLLAVLAIAIPFSVIAFAKFGGWPNSLLPALLAMMAFCVMRLPHMVKRLEDRSRSRPEQVALGSFLAVLLLMTTFPHLTWENGLIVPRSRWDKDYRETLASPADCPALSSARRIPRFLSMGTATSG